MLESDVLVPPDPDATLSLEALELAVREAPRGVAIVDRGLRQRLDQA